MGWGSMFEDMLQHSEQETSVQWQVVDARCPTPLLQTQAWTVQDDRVVAALRVPALTMVNPTSGADWLYAE